MSPTIERTPKGYTEIAVQPVADGVEVMLRRPSDGTAMYVVLSDEAAMLHATAVKAAVERRKNAPDEPMR